MTPLDRDPRARLQFGSDGSVRAYLADHDATETVRVLKLDSERLRKLRGAAIDAYLGRATDGAPIARLLLACDQPRQGRHQPFGSAVRAVLTRL